MGEGRKAETDRAPAVSMGRTSPWIEKAAAIRTLLGRCAGRE